jgi:hypothetical protein
MPVKAKKESKVLSIRISPIGRNRVRLLLRVNKKRPIDKATTVRLKHLGPSARKFYKREILRLPAEHKEQAVTYIGNPLEVAKAQERALATSQEERKKKLREHLIANLRQRPQPKGKLASPPLPNGLPFPPYCEAEVYTAYHCTRHHPKFNPFARQPPVHAFEETGTNSDIEEGEIIKPGAFGLSDDESPP